MSKAKITATQLADYMDLGKNHGKSLKPYCDAAADICNAWAGEELKDSHSARQALSLTAVWLMTTGNTEVDQLKNLPLQIRYFINEASAGV